MKHIPFLALIATELDEFDGNMLAAALAEAPPRVDGRISSMSETLDLTRIAFDPEIRSRLLEAGEKSSVRVVLPGAAEPKAQCLNPQVQGSRPNKSPTKIIPKIPIIQIHSNK